MKHNELCLGSTIGITEHAPPDSPSTPTVRYFDASEGVRPTGIKRKRLKCPRCSRRLMSSVSVCDDGCCVYHRIPTHKPKGWWKRKKIMKRKKRKGRNVGNAHQV